jgi:hypothetical protein
MRGSGGDGFEYRETAEGIALNGGYFADADTQELRTTLENTEATTRESSVETGGNPPRLGFSLEGCTKESS